MILSMRNFVIILTAAICTVNYSYAKNDINLDDDSSVKHYMNAIGIMHPSDIKSVQISFSSGLNYDLSYPNDSAQITCLYEALLQSGRLGSGYPGAENLIILNTKDDKTYFLIFSLINDFATSEYYISGTSEHPPLLDSCINSILYNSNAAYRNSRLGPLAIRSISVYMPNKKMIDAQYGSKQYIKLRSKALAILDCLDIRSIVYKEQDQDEIDRAEKKFGRITIELYNPTDIDLYKIDFPTNLPARDNPDIENYGFGDTLKHIHVKCLSIMIGEYGNYNTPSVILHTSDGYYLFDKLTRKEQEKYGVEKCKLPGHPIKDRTYYKSPKELYNELYSIMKTLSNK